MTLSLGGLVNHDKYTKKDARLAIYFVLRMRTYKRE